MSDVIRSCSKTRPSIRSHDNHCRQIVLPLNQLEYIDIWEDPRKVREKISGAMNQHPELFPHAMREDGYHLTGFTKTSKKMSGVRLRQIRVGKIRYYLRPSFLMKYHTGTVEELSGPLFFMSIGVPPWALTRVFGKNDMFWHRHLERLGKNSLVGTTIACGSDIPKHIAADEHHAKWGEKKGYVGMTVGEGCILGMGLSAGADEESLKEAYGDFKNESSMLEPSYSPETVNTDGWTATGNAFVHLFSTVTVILCFLHGFLKIRNRGRKERELHQSVWEVYRAETIEEFRMKMKELVTWATVSTDLRAAVLEPVKKLAGRVEQYAKSYSHPKCLRTSNMVDRLMNRLTRFLYDGRGLHGHQHSSELRLRGWALVRNFTPYAPRSNTRREFTSPAHAINKKVYHSHWLHNLNIATSLGGYRNLST